MIGIGFIVSTWVGYGSSKVPITSSFSWRFPLGFQCIPCVILIAGILFFPESPRYLIETDRAEEAMQVLKKLHCNGSNDNWIQSEFNEIKLTIEAEKAITAPGWLVMFRVKAWRIRLMHATLAQVFTQMTGCVPSHLLPLTRIRSLLTHDISASTSSDITVPSYIRTSASLEIGTCSSQESIMLWAQSATSYSSHCFSTGLAAESRCYLAQSVSLSPSSAKLSLVPRSPVQVALDVTACLSQGCSSYSVSPASSVCRLDPSHGYMLQVCRVISYRVTAI